MWGYSCGSPKLSRLLSTDFVTGIFMLVVAYLYVSYLKSAERPIVSTNNGKVRGVVSFSRDYLKFHAFLGIPYAKAPIDDLRFEVPQPPENWDGVRDAGAYRSQCISLELLFIGGVLFGSEDCLYLQVFQPVKRAAAKPLPVMVFFHGGMFHFGSAEDHGPDYIMNEDVVLVTVTYRLGALGFLSTGDNVVPGNMGLKDQTMALQWIQSNIHFFGGNPRKVTLFGESAGGVSVGLHILSPLSQGLFHKAISQSGSMLNSWGVMKQTGAQAREFASKFNCPTNNNRDMITCLKQIDAKSLVLGHMESVDYFRTREMIFTPTIEAVNTSTAFLVEHPKRILEKGNFHKVPWIMGVNADEGLLQTAALAANATKLAIMTQFQLSLPVTLYYKRNDLITDKIQSYYFDKLYTNSTRQNLLRNLTNLFSDRHFNHPVSATAKLYSKHAPLYLYYLNYSGFLSMEHIIASRETEYLHPILSLIITQSWNIFQQFIMGVNVKGNGTCHANELPLLFNHPWTPSIFSKLPERDVKMSKDLVSLWVSFARSRDLLMLGKTRWKSVEPGKPLRYLEIGEEPRMIEEPFTERVEFWESIMNKLQEPDL